MFKDFFEFDPTHKIILAANHKPVIRGVDHANWRRIKLVPWTATITADLKDKDLPAELLEKAPGILAWAVRGCLDWRRDGLREPAVVTEATAAYKREQDTLQGFIDSCCKVGPCERVTFGAFLEAYQSWTGDKSMTNRALSPLKDLGYEGEKKNKGVLFYGIGLPENER